MSKQPAVQVQEEEQPQIPKIWQPEVDLKELKVEIPTIE